MTILNPTIIPRAEHCISRKFISKNALKVLYRLHTAGYGAYLVGGCVRDLLLGHVPKDFDIATDAHPEEVKKLFKNCRLIGRRFRLAHILFGKEIIEVATFRKEHGDASNQQGYMQEGRIIRDNVYGTIEDDVTRRDFTVNALYYNIADFSVIDFTGGMEDLKNRRLHMIGNPEGRFIEDPVRLLRAVRFASKLNFSISVETEAPILLLSNYLESISNARLFQEVLKFFQSGSSIAIFKLLKKYNLVQELFPVLSPYLNDTKTIKLIEATLTHTDNRVKESKTLSPAFLLAVFCWPAILDKINKIPEEELTYEKTEFLIKNVLKAQKVRLDMPNALMTSILEICLMQYRFAFRRGKQAHRLLHHPRFRAAYDLLLLREESGEPIKTITTWWQDFCQTKIKAPHTS